MHIRTFTFNMFGVNTYLVWNAATHDAAVFDPGMIGEAEQRSIDTFISARELRLTRMINTHLHVDHIFGACYIAEKYNLPLEASEADAFLGRQAQAQARMFQLPMAVKGVKVDSPLEDGMHIDVCGEEVTVIGVPGHSPGSLAFYFPESHWVITGDTLFAGSIGRTDLVGGNYNSIVNSIRQKLFTLPDSTVVYPGHGEPTTIGREKRGNPYVG